ncbi:MAG TPA: tetratricopeptide repeat protein [Terriglobales bacterium]|nr:tetratricopeptide repeat protein [Terriglobales bacterium]
MVFGFGFNKAKVLASAERNVKQGKLHHAIADYEKVIKEDPKDLTVMNAIGDLYARVGNPEKAAEYFRKVGDAYAADGFTVRAIALYKKLAKQDPNSLDIVLKLAELYTQQGLYNDARTQYLQVAEFRLRNGELQKAAGIFQKMLELDPENIPLQSRLAELLVRLNRSAEARDLYFRNAEGLFSRGALDQADDALARVIGIDPAFSQAILLRGTVKLKSGDPAAAAQILEKLPDIDSRPDGLQTLLKAYLEIGKLDDAEPVARKMLRVFNDASGIAAYAEALMASGAHEQALRCYREHADCLLVSQTARLAEALESCIARVKSSTSALEILAELFHRAGKSEFVVEVTELLAHAFVQDGDILRARDHYQKLMALEPDNAQHAQNYRQCVARLSGSNARTIGQPLDQEAQAFAIEEVQVAGEVEQSYPTHIAEAVEAALTDSELFDSYNLAGKAIVPLEKVLAKAPRDIRLNRRLASLYARSGRPAEAAARCRVLENVYLEAGHVSDASQFAELAVRYRERAGLAPEEPSANTVASAVPASPEPVIPADCAATQPIAAPQPLPAAAIESTPRPEPLVRPSVQEPSSAAHEFDLSAEWDEMVELEPPEDTGSPAAELAPTPSSVEDPGQTVAVFDSFDDPSGLAGIDPAASDQLDEIRFYISQSMWVEARAAMARFESAFPGLPELAELKAELASDQGEAASIPTELQVEILDEGPIGVGPTSEAATTSITASAGTEDDPLDKLVLDLEASLGKNFELVPVPAVSSGTEHASEVLKPQPSSPPQFDSAIKIATTVPSHHSVSAATEVVAEEEDAPGALSDIFAEFKESMEAGADTNEDPETHYNLGVAFKEMGLLDEAIGELQKVCQAIERGHSFSQAMQAYTWLADCFLQKGVPEAAVRWYEKALKTSMLDNEVATAIHYELACAHEAAGNRASALTHFMEVYGTNIDYRDVAERIKALKS